jgi:peptidoglycan/LPS O-acetylase OafA/YrhL
MVVIAILLVLGWFWLPTPDYQALGAQSAFGLTFLSNIYYWRSAGYFDAAAQEKWLLHTWSLAVEAQFYLLYPVFVALMWRFWSGLKALTIGLGALFVASLALNLIVTFWKPTVAFYLLPTRGWELAAGGLVYLIARQGWASEALKVKGFWLGWLLVIASFALIEESMAWPGYWAILPVLGASLIILGQREDCFLTNNALAQWLGDRSYSLYLWHWPLVVALYFAGLQSDWSWVLGFMALSLLLAHLSYRFVEVPTRAYLSAASLRKEIFAIGVAGAVIGLAAVSVKLVVFDGRLDPAVEMAAAENKNGPDTSFCWADGHGAGEYDCELLDRTEKPKAPNFSLVIKGDSHSLHLRSAISQAVINTKLYDSIKYWGMSGCHSIESASHSLASGRDPKYCNEMNVSFFSKMESGGQNILIVDRTNLGLYGFNGILENGKGPWVSFGSEYSDEDRFQQKFRDDYVSSLCKLASKNALIVMRPVPELIVDPPLVLSRNMLFGRGSEDIKITLAEYHARNKLVWDAQDQSAALCGVKILDPLPYLCDDQYCYGSKNGRPLYYDDDHLSEYGNKFLVPMFEEVFEH